ncbi:MAG: isoprenylcysteine carboxylmethyltransferase family protein [Deltaproteobacteria bacterium]|nr:isoprenylcysteine carboxylmethyltransferase family protein [Deltaproteobacteria bacterium]
MAAYLATLAALFVRFVDPEAARAPRRLVASEADLALVRRHHALFYLLVAAAPVEWWLHGCPAGPWQTVGAALAATGVCGYRRAGRVLGDQLSPLVAPVEPARLVEDGWYGRIRHPMYLAELALALGLPILLAAPWTLVVSALFLVAVVRRIGVEERALTARFPDYPAYASRTSRLLPHVY